MGSIYKPRSSERVVKSDLVAKEKMGILPFEVRAAQHQGPLAPGQPTGGGSTEGRGKQRGASQKRPSRVCKLYKAANDAAVIC